MSPDEPGTNEHGNNGEQARIAANVQRAAGRQALKQIRTMVDEERREDAANARFVRAFLKYGLIIMLAASLLLAHFLGAF